MSNFIDIRPPYVQLLAGDSFGDSHVQRCAPRVLSRLGEILMGGTLLAIAGISDRNLLGLECAGTGKIPKSALALLQNYQTLLFDQPMGRGDTRTKEFGV